MCLGNHYNGSRQKKNGGIDLILIRNGNVHDGLGQVLAKTDILIDNGKIVRIGQHLEVAQAQVIEAEGKCVMPGWIDPLSGWGTAAGRGQARDNDETSDPLTPQLDVYYAFDPESMMYQELWGYGITAAGVAPSSNNILGGSTAVFKAYGKTAEAMCVKAPAALKGSVDEKVKQTYGPRNIAPMTKMGIFSALRELIAKCRSDKAEDQKDLKVQAFRPVLEGRLPLILNCNTKAEADAVLSLFEKEPVQLILANMYQLDESLMEKACGLILGDLTDGFNRYNAAVDYKALFDLIKAGKPVALSAFGDAVSPGREILMWNAHGLLAQARRLGAEITSEDVLKMLTSVPAQLLGVADRIGSLTEGKDADVVIWSGNPLETFRALPETVMISGEIVKGEKAA